MTMLDADSSGPISPSVSPYTWNIGRTVMNRSCPSRQAIRVATWVAFARIPACESCASLSVPVVPPVGWRIAVWCGCGATLSGHNLTDPSPNGECESEAIRLALGDGAIAPDEIDYVAAHGTSTAKNDAVETAAVKRALGGQAARTAISSNKGQIGHTISAAGVCNVICAAKALSDGWIPPTAHYRTPDPACDLDYVPNLGRRASPGLPQ